MITFTWIYKKSPRQSDTAGNIEKENLAGSFKGLSYYFIYVVNILTNHGILQTLFITTTSISNSMNKFILLAIGDYSPFSRHSFRILAGGLLLASLVLVNSYSSIVMSSLTVPIRNPAVNSLEDLVDNEDVSLIIQKDVILGTLILVLTNDYKAND